MAWLTLIAASAHSLLHNNWNDRARLGVRLLRGAAGVLLVVGVLVTALLYGPWSIRRDATA